MTIRPAQSHDWPSIGALAELLVTSHYTFDRARFVPPHVLGRDAYVARLHEEIDRATATVLVAEVEGQVAGYVLAGIEPPNWKELRDEAGYVHDLVVAPAHQRKGAGRALLAAATDWIAARGVSRVMLWTAPANAGAQRLFRDAGFRTTMIEMTLDRGANRR